MRRFGFFKIYNTTEFNKITFFNKLGLEPFNKKFNVKYFQKYMGYKVYIFIKTKDYKENSEYDKIVYKDSEYIIINSGLKLIEIIEKDKDAINKEIFSKVNK